MCLHDVKCGGEFNLFIIPHIVVVYVPVSIIYYGIFLSKQLLRDSSPVMGYNPFGTAGLMHFYCLSSF